MRKWGLNIVFLLVALCSFGQKLNTSINKDHIKIGEPFTLTLSVISNTKLDSLRIVKHTSDFPAESSSNTTEKGINTAYELEVLRPFMDTSYKEKNQFIWEGTYQLTGWDSAYVVVPPQQIYINDSLYFFSPGLIHITSPDANPSKPIYDINETFTQIKIQNTKWIQFLKNNWWWLAAILLGIIILLIVLLKYSKKKNIPLSLRQVTLKKIDLLEEGKGYESSLKEYYFDLSIILRRFFAGHYQTPIMDKTTSEIEHILLVHKLDKEMTLLVRQLLIQSDMVKFAKSRPELEEIRNITNKARRVVNEIADLDLNDE